MTRDIVLGVSVHAEAGAIQRAITSQTGLAAFWTSDVAAEPTVGSEARFGFHETPALIKMRVDRIDPDRVGWTCLGDFPFWTDTRVSWSLSPEPEGGGTQVLFMHEGFPAEQPDWQLGTVAHTWSTVLDHLKEHAETGVTKPALG